MAQIKDLIHRMHLHG